MANIRTISTTTTLCGGALLLIVLTDEPWVWAILRLATGVGISGCYVIIESWLNEQTSNEYRGRVLGIYSMLVLIAMSVGQVLVNVGPPIGVTSIVVGSLLLSFSVVAARADQS